jgi:hypothetical protein
VWWPSLSGQVRIDADKSEEYGVTWGEVPVKAAV